MPRGDIHGFGSLGSSSAGQGDIHGFGAPKAPAVTTSTGSRPNILFILADDLSWSSTGYNAANVGGDLTFATPFLDKLSKQGITLDRYYAAGTCTPSRAMLMTGQYAHRIGAQFGNLASFSNLSLPLDVVTLADGFKSAGYSTSHFGKWHLGHAQPAYLPTQRGFDEFLGYLLGETQYFAHTTLNHGASFYDLSWENATHYGSAWEQYKDQYSAFIYTEATARALNASAAKGAEADPFFIYLAYQNTHSPLTELDDTWFTDNELTALAGVEGSARRMYAKHLLMLDKQVERVYGVLEANGQLDNTYIVFASDNGGCHLEGGHTWPLRGVKNTVYEGGMRVPAFVYSPMLPENVRGLNFTGSFSVVDWFPTFASMVSYDTTGMTIDGVDYSPLLLGTDTSAQRTDLVYNIVTDVQGLDYDIWTNGSFAVSKVYGDRTYKLVHAFYIDYDGPNATLADDDQWATVLTCDAVASGEFLYQLFDITNDPYETTNLYWEDSAEYEQIKFELYEMVDEAMAVTTSCQYYSSNTYKSTASKVWSMSAFEETVGPFFFDDCGTFNIEACTDPNFFSDDSIAQ